MTKNSLTKEQARHFLKTHALNEICEITDFSKFYTSAFCMVAKYGLQQEAEEEDLLSGDEWSNPMCREILIKKVEKFLNKYIR